MKEGLDPNHKGGISKDSLIDGFRAIGVSEGDCLGLGISFKSIGCVVGGPNVFIDSLIEVIGSKGTLMIPAYTRFFRLSKIDSETAKNYVFDYKSTPAKTGLIPETLRKKPGSTRSRHPTNSIASYGKHAEYLTKGHDENSGAYQPYSRLAELNGKILCIGIGDNLVGIRHEAQNLAGLLGVVPRKDCVRFQDENGKIRLFHRRDKGGCVRKLPELTPLLREQNMLCEGKIGMADSILAPAKETLEIMINALKNNPAKYLCDEITCLWCREIERLLNLYDAIENPWFFQKRFLAKKSIALINRFRMR